VLLNIVKQFLKIFEFCSNLISVNIDIFPFTTERGIRHLHDFRSYDLDWGGVLLNLNVDIAVFCDNKMRK